MILETIMVWLLAAFLIWAVGVMYYEFTEYNDIPNIIEVFWEILGGWILTATLYMEESEYGRTNA